MKRKSNKEKMESFILKMFKEFRPGYENYFIDEDGYIKYGNDWERRKYYDPVVFVKLILNKEV